MELKAVGGYGVTSELFQKVRGYNECSRAEIERRFSKGVLKHRPATGPSMLKDLMIDN